MLGLRLRETDGLATLMLGLWLGLAADMLGLRLCEGLAALIEGDWLVLGLWLGLAAEILGLSEILADWLGLNEILGDAAETLGLSEILVDWDGERLMDGLAAEMLGLSEILADWLGLRLIDGLAAEILMLGDIERLGESEVLGLTDILVLGLGETPESKKKKYRVVTLISQKVVITSLSLVHEAGRVDVRQSALWRCRRSCRNICCRCWFWQ